MITDDLTNSDQSWILINPDQQRQSRNHAREVKNSDGQIAFFKAPAPHVLANEVLAFVLAEKLNLPCAKVKFAKLFDSGLGPSSGILSFKVSGVTPIEWPLLPSEVTNKPKSYVMNIPDLSKIAVFDIWTYNTDRSTANLIISRKEEWGKKFMVYMIDQEECLYGYADMPNRHENDGQWLNVDRFVQIPILKESMKFSEIADFIEEIQSISDEDLKQMIGLIPNEYYNQVQGGIVFDLLQKRRNSLKQIIEDWCRSQNKL